MKLCFIECQRPVVSPEMLQHIPEHFQFSGQWWPSLTTKTRLNTHNTLDDLTPPVSFKVLSVVADFCEALFKTKLYRDVVESYRMHLLQAAIF